MLTVSFHPFPTLETERMDLTAFTPADAEALFQMRSNPTVMQYIQRPRPKSVADVKPYLQRLIDDAINNKGITWAMRLKGTNRLIGTAGFWQIDEVNYRAEIGYAMEPEFQGQGLMSEVLIKIIDYAFREMKLHSLMGNTHPDNKKSQAILQRMGFQQEAHHREDYYFEGAFYDSVKFGLLERDYRAKFNTSE